MRAEVPARAQQCADGECVLIEVMLVAARRGARDENDCHSKLPNQPNLTFHFSLSVVGSQPVRAPDSDTLMRVPCPKRPPGQALIPTRLMGKRTWVTTPKRPLSQPTGGVSFRPADRPSLFH